MNVENFAFKNHNKNGNKRKEIGKSKHRNT